MTCFITYYFRIYLTYFDVLGQVFWPSVLKLFFRMVSTVTRWRIFTTVLSLLLNSKIVENFLRNTSLKTTIQIKISSEAKVKAIELYRIICWATWPYHEVTLE